MACTRSESAYTSISQKLTVEHLSNASRALAVLWSCLNELYLTTNRLPKRDDLWLAAKAKSKPPYEPLAAAELCEIKDLLRVAFEQSPDDFDVDVAKDDIRQFLEEQLLVSVSDAVATPGRIRPINVAQLLAEYADQAADLESLSSDVIDDPFPDGWSPQRVVPQPLGVNFIDELLNGGQVATEVYGLMGPFGSCKTTLMIQMSITLARQARRIYDDQIRNGILDASLGLVYYLQYEESVDPAIKLRALSYAGVIDRTSLEQKDLHGLSTAANPNSIKEYEKRTGLLSKQAKTAVSGELERYRAAIAELNINWRPVDMAGGDPKNPKRGSGLVAEIATVVKNDLEKRSAKMPVHCAGVFIDYVGIACERYMDANDIPSEDLRKYIKKFPQMVRKQVAVPNNCAIWLAHQFSGEANSRQAGTVLHHSQAAECRSFAEHLDAVFNIGIKSKDNMVPLDRSKGRRMAPSEEIVLKINGAMSCVEDARGTHIFDSVSRRIVPKTDYNRVVDPGEGGSKRGIGEMALKSKNLFP